MLAINHEGMDVAHWLNARGIAAFVLKYRLVQTTTRDEDFMEEVEEALSKPNKMIELTRQIGRLAIANRLPDGTLQQSELA